jgi:hypothetical protein
MIKVLRKLGIEGKYFNIIKAVYDKPTANIILNGEKTETISPKIRKETRVPNIPTPIQYSTGIPVQSIRQEEGIKGIQITKETVKIFLFADNMVLCLKDPKNSIQKLLDTINSYSKVAGYKINLQKSLAFLYTNNKQTEKEYMETILYPIASKKSNT